MDDTAKLKALIDAMGENEKIYRLILGGCLAPIALLGSKFDSLSGMNALEGGLLTAALILLLLASGLAISAVARSHTCRRNLLHLGAGSSGFGQVQKMEATAEALNGFAILFGGLGYLCLTGLFIAKVWGG